MHLCMLNEASHARKNDSAVNQAVIWISLKITTSFGAPIGITDVTLITG